jgi:hypothetical protein
VVRSSKKQQLILPDPKRRPAGGLMPQISEVPVCDRLRRPVEILRLQLDPLEGQEQDVEGAPAASAEGPSRPQRVPSAAAQAQALSWLRL